MAQWRRFSFFEKELVKDGNGKSWLRGVNITCMAASRGIMAIGDADGAIHMADRQLHVHKFQAYEHFVSHAIMLQKMNFLVTVGDGIDPRDPADIKKSKKIAEAARRGNEQHTHAPAGDVRKSTAIVKIWRTDQTTREGHPKLMNQVRIFLKYPEEAVTAFAVTSDIGQVAVGLANGAVILFRSDLKRRGEPRPPALLQPAAQYPVTGLSFMEQGTEKKKTMKIYLYASTKRGLTSYHCNRDEGAGKAPGAYLLDERGVEKNCSAVNEEGEIAVGQPDAVYFFTPEDRGVCFAFDGEKKYLSFFKHYLLVAHIDPRGRHQVNVYDLKNKFIAFNWTLTLGHSSRSKREEDDPEEVKHVIAEFGSLFVVSSMGHIYRLTEKDTASKLDILFRKNLYSIAISLAFSSNYDIENIVDIFRMYGDHLYGKGDLEGAIQQYNRTIGHIEPSYVIRKFLDAQRIRCLTTYLEELHKKGFANSEHTTLLLNCYTKLKDVKKLDQFLRPDEYRAEESKDESNENDMTMTTPVYSLTFDVETAISVLRSNYPTHALSLAKKHKEHSWYLKIQLEHISYVDDDELKPNDQARVLDAFHYIQRLDFADAENNLKKYGRTLVTHLPSETTELLKILCTGRYVPNTSDENTAPSPSTLSNPDQKSDAGEFIHLYVAHPQHLRTFLEYIVEKEPGTSPAVGNTLLELILQEQEEDIGKKEKAVLKILDNPRVKYDGDHALILVQMHQLKEGQRYLYGKLHMHHMLIQQFMEVNDSQSVLEEVQKHGLDDPNLCLTVLKYFSTQSKLKELKEVLKLIEQIPSLPPLQVVQVLCQVKNLPLSVARSYLVNRLKKDEELIDQDQEEIEKFQVDTERMKKEVDEMSKKAMVFQATKCDLCDHELDPPAVHFMCQHSFHQSCIPEHDYECTICAPEHRHVLTLMNSLEQKASNHEQFYNQLETSGDGFNTIAEYFGKGIFKTEPPENISGSTSGGRFNNEI